MLDILTLNGAKLLMSSKRGQVVYSQVKERLGQAMLSDGCQRIRATDPMEWNFFGFCLLTS